MEEISKGQVIKGLICSAHELGIFLRELCVCVCELCVYMCVCVNRFELLKVVLPAALRLNES